MSFLGGLQVLGRRPSVPVVSRSAKLYRPGPAPGYSPDQPLTLDWNARASTEHGFKASSWVYRCVTMSMEAGAQAPFGLQTLDERGHWHWDWAAPESRLLADWNDDFGPQECVQRAISHLLLNGNSLIAKYGKGSLPRELWVESPVDVECRPAKMGGGIGYYEATRDGELKRWEKAEIIHNRLVNPANPYWGIGRLITLANAVDTDVMAAEANKRRLDGGGVPTGLLIDETVTNQEDRDLQQSLIDDAWKDSGSGPLVVASGTQWVQMGMSPVDLQWLEGRNFTMREIVITFGYHPALFGEDGTYANSEVAERVKWTGAVLPVMSKIAEGLSRGLIPRGQRHNRRIWYDTSGIAALQGDLKTRCDAYRGLVAAGVPPDWGKAALGLPWPDLADGLGQVPLVMSNHETLARVIEGMADQGAGTGGDPLAGDGQPGTTPDANQN